MILNLETLVAPITGVVLPFIVQLVRNQVLPELDTRSAFLLALAVSLVASACGYVALDPTPTLKEFGANYTVVFTLSQLTYRALESQLKGEDNG